MAQNLHFQLMLLFSRLRLQFWNFLATVPNWTSKLEPHRKHISHNIYQKYFILIINCLKIAWFKIPRHLCDFHVTPTTITAIRTEKVPEYLSHCPPPTVYTCCWPRGLETHHSPFCFLLQKDPHGNLADKKRRGKNRQVPASNPDQR